MAKGYWDYGYMRGCICCRSGAKDKYLCQTCLHVTKGIRSVAPTCPTCQTPMTNMGQRWRPAKKSKRKPEQKHRPGIYPSRAKTLLDTIMEKKRRADGDYS